MNWNIEKIGKVLINRNETPNNELIIQGIIPIISKIGFKDGQIELRTDGKSNTQLILIEPDDIVISGINVEKGAIGINNFKKNIAATIHYSSYYVNKTLSSKEFLYFYFRSPEFGYHLKQSFPNGIKTEIKPKDFLSLEIPLPPLEEQNRIVKILDKVQQKSEQAIRLKADIISEIKLLLTCLIDEVFLKYKDTNELISEICERPQYGYTASASQEDLGFKLLRITDIQNGIVNWKTVPFCNCSRPDNYLLKDDDILFARTGGTIGKSFLVKEVPNNAIFASYLIRLRTRENIEPKYLYHFFQSNLYWSQINDNKKGTGQPNLNGTKLSTLFIPMPKNNGFQKKVISEIEEIYCTYNDLLYSSTESLKELEELFPALLDKAFKGEL